jgi:hypothetical protein
MAQLCGECGKRPALFKYRGRIKADSDHHICLQCFRSLSESNTQKEKHMTARLIDAKGLKLTDALFAEAYRATIPTLADAKHVSIRACPARLAELTSVAKDISDVVELGQIGEKLHGKLVLVTRAVAVPVSVHIGDGALVVEDETFSPGVVSFEVNGIPELQIVNLAVSDAELAAERKAKDEAMAAAEAKDQAALHANLEVDKAAAFKAGRHKAISDAKQKLLDEEMKRGEASVANAPAHPTESKPDAPTADEVAAAHAVIADHDASPADKYKARQVLFLAGISKPTVQ